MVLKGIPIYKYHREESGLDFEYFSTTLGHAKDAHRRRVDRLGETVERDWEWGPVARWRREGRYMAIAKFHWVAAYKGSNEEIYKTVAKTFQHIPHGDPIPDGYEEHYTEKARLKRTIPG